MLNQTMHFEFGQNMYGKYLIHIFYGTTMKLSVPDSFTLFRNSVIRHIHSATNHYTDFFFILTPSDFGLIFGM